MQKSSCRSMCKKGVSDVVDNSSSRSCRAADRLPGTPCMRRFRCYRPTPPDEYYRLGTANPPDAVQFEGILFSDGTVVLRWMTAYNSHSIWQSFDDMMAVHGHPEYGTHIEWLDD